MSWNKFFKAAGKAIAAVQTQQASAKPKIIPIMTMEMIQSNGGPITAAQAVKLFKEFALKTGYLYKEELTEHGQYFAQEMKDEAEFLEQDAKGELDQLKYDLNELKDQRKEAKAREQELKAEFKDTTEACDKDRIKEEIAHEQEKLEGIAEELSMAEIAIQEEVERLAPIAKAWADFKADKRQFLVTYTNRQTQGR